MEGAAVELNDDLQTIAGQLASFAASIATIVEKDKKAPYRGYDDAVAMYNQLRVHADRDVFPEDLLREKAPNELPSEFKYRKSIYRCPTFPYWQRAENAVMRIWNEQNYTFSFNPDVAPFDTKDTAEKYFFEDYPHFGSITAQFRAMVTSTALKDPNAVILIEPERWNVEQTELLEPIITLHSSPEVWAYKSEKHALLRAEDVSLEKGETGLSFTFVDTRFIARIVQVGRKNDYKFEVAELFEHGLDQMPASRIGAVPTTSADRALVYQSWFYPARPALDQAICDFSTLQMSKFANAFMQRWEYISGCDNKDCVDGKVFDGETQITCTTCNGNGRRARISPLGVMEVDLSDLASVEDAKAMHIPPAGYIEVNSDILSFLDEQVKTNIKAGWEVIGLDVMPQVNGTETATGRVIDREELHSLLIAASQTIFDLMDWAVDLMGRMRYGDKWQGAVIKAPDTFEISKPHELTEELNSAHPSVKKAIAKEYVNRRLGDDAWASLLAIELDPLFGVDETIITNRAASGLIPKWQVVLHMQIHDFILQAIEMNTEFESLPKSAQRAELTRLAKQFVAENTPNTAQSILDSLPKG